MSKKKTTLGIDLTDEERKKLREEIIYYFESERDEKLGIIASESILDFFLDHLGKSIYNKALEDAKRWFAKRIEDIDADYYALFKDEN